MGLGFRRGSALVLLLLGMFGALAFGEDSSAQMRSAVDSAVNLLFKEAPLEKDRAKRFALLKAGLEPMFDFDGFTSRVMGKYYKTYGESGRDKLKPVLEEGFFKIYELYLSQLQKNGALDRLSFELQAPQFTDEKKTQALLNVRIGTKGSSEAPMMLTLSFVYSEKAGKFLGVNLILNNVNYGLNLRNSFYQAMSAHKDDFGAVLKDWRVDPTLKS